MQGNRRRNPSRRFAAKPVEMGKEYDVDIQEMSRRGEGLARIQGLITFVPDTRPRDEVRIKITRISRRFAEGEVVGEVGETLEAEEEESPEE